MAPRERGGARATTCTSREDVGCRVAIHHTAGRPTWGGTVQGAVQDLQGVATDGGGDRRGIPNPVLIGHDGILCAGRTGADSAGRREAAAGGRPVAGPRAMAGSGAGAMGSRTTDLPAG